MAAPERLIVPDEKSIQHELPCRFRSDRLLLPALHAGQLVMVARL
jgi:hypothetical protein